MDGSEKGATDKRRKIKVDGKAGGKRWGKTKRIEVRHGRKRGRKRCCVRTKREGKRKRVREIGTESPKGIRFARR